MRLHHVGIATDNIEDTIEYVRKVYDVKDISEIVFDPLQNAKLCMITLADDSMIELISGDTVQKFVDKRQYIYHLCYEVDNLDEKIEEYKENRDILMGQPKEAVLFNKRRVAFVFTKLGIIELLEK